MRPALRIPIALLVVLAVTACTNASAGWTYTPAPPATPVPSAAPSASAAASASAAPSASAAASAGASAGASGGTVGAPIPVVAQGIAFTTNAITAPANTPFQIDFDNEDASTQHNIFINDAGGSAVFKGDVFAGVAHKTYDVPALPAGAYTFHCIVHANMTGTLTVQ
jgi:plastocyanin